MDRAHARSNGILCKIPEGIAEQATVPLAGGRSKSFSTTAQRVGDVAPRGTRDANAPHLLWLAGLPRASTSISSRNPGAKS